MLTDARVASTQTESPPAPNSTSWRGGIHAAPANLAKRRVEAPHSRPNGARDSDGVSIISIVSFASFTLGTNGEDAIHDDSEYAAAFRRRGCAGSRV